MSCQPPLEPLTASHQKATEDTPLLHATLLKPIHVRTGFHVLWGHSIDIIILYCTNCIFYHLTLTLPINVPITWSPQGQNVLVLLMWGPHNVRNTRTCTHTHK